MPSPRQKRAHQNDHRHGLPAAAGLNRRRWPLMAMAPRLTSSSDRTGGNLRTQVGPAAWVPIWVAGVGLTDGEFRVYVALRSFADRDGGNCYPTARSVAARAFVAYSTARNALQKFNAIGLVEVEHTRREDGGQSSNDYLLIDVCTPELAARIEANRAKRDAEEAAQKQAAKTTKSAKAQVSGGPKTSTPPTLHKVGGGYPTQGRAPTPRKVGRATPHGVAITTPGLTTPETTSLSAVAKPAAATQEREIPAQRATQPPSPAADLVDGLVAEALVLHPAWSPRLTRQAILNELKDRPAELVAVAWRLCITQPGTTTPNRFQHPMSWWDTAYGLNDPGPTPSSNRTAADCQLCDPAGWVVDADDRPTRRCDHTPVPAVAGQAP